MFELLMHGLYEVPREINVNLVRLKLLKLLHIHFVSLGKNHVLEMLLHLASY